MPLNRCEDEGRPGWKWGDAGKCYVYTVGNEESETAARKKALAQAAAMGEFPGTGQNRSALVEIRAAVDIENVDFPKRTIDLIAVPYDQEAVVPYEGRMVVESIAPGAFDVAVTRNATVPANRDHDHTRTFGRVTGYKPDKSGLITNIKASATLLGDETLQLADDGVLKGSVGMLVRRADQILKRDTRRITRAFLDHLAMVPNPAYQGSEVLAVRQEQLREAVPTPNLDTVLILLGMRD